MTERLGLLVEAFAGSLSAALVADLEAEARGLQDLAAPDERRAEVRRLVRRHAGAHEAAGTDKLVEAVWGLGPRGYGPEREQLTEWIGALQVARFLAMEGR